ncbi:MAG: hypothetical protein LBN43_04370 [Oscillospiraceae bacterium]|jgi:hypothetical protein|nr:hypothetical protein [Oscillospiraceae bacterium]
MKALSKTRRLAAMLLTVILTVLPLISANAAEEERIPAVTLDLPGGELYDVTMNERTYTIDKTPLPDGVSLSLTNAPATYLKLEQESGYVYYDSDAVAAIGYYFLVDKDFTLTVNQDITVYREYSWYEEEYDYYDSDTNEQKLKAGESWAPDTYFAGDKIILILNKNNRYIMFAFAYPTDPESTAYYDFDDDYFTTAQTVNFNVNLAADLLKTPGGITATPTTANVLINGKAVDFDAYNINDNNYFKLRDVAYALNGTAKQFDIVWDARGSLIKLTGGNRYAEVGGEMTPADGENKIAVISEAKVFYNGKPANLTAYNIGGNNYFKLADIGDMLNCGVEWDAESNTISIDTSAEYVPEWKTAIKYIDGSITVVLPDYDGLEITLTNYAENYLDWSDSTYAFFLANGGTVSFNRNVELETNNDEPITLKANEKFTIDSDSGYFSISFDDEYKYILFYSEDFLDDTYYYGEDFYPITDIEK